MTTRPLTIACLLYLLLPCLLFLAGWVQPVVAWPAGIMLTAAVAWVAALCPARQLKWQAGEAGRVLLLLLLGVLWVLTTGPFGVVEQSGDATVRNAIYESLVRDSWPLTVAGNCFIYYLGFWLPPALAAKCGVPAEAALLGWSLLGVWLALLAISCGKGSRHALVFLVILLLLGSLTGWANRVCYKFATGSALDLVQNWALFLDLHYPPSCVQLRNTFNHYIAPLVLLSMLAGKMIPTRFSAVGAAMVLICSPLAAVALVPLLVLRAGRSLLNPPVVLAGLYAPLPLLYLLGGEAGVVAFMRPAGPCCLAELSATQLWCRYALQVISIAGPACLFLWRWRRTSWFWCSIILTMGLPLVWVGLWNNEFIYKGAAVIWFCLAWLYAYAWCHARGRRKGLLALFFLFSASDTYGQVMGALKSFRTHPEEMRLNLRDEWQGKLHQEHDARARQFKGTPLLPGVFKFKD